MPSSETRSVKQCTLTPVVNDRNVGDDKPGFVPAKPYLKLAVLSTIIMDGRLVHSILSKMPEVNATIKRATELLVQRMPLEAAKLLGEIPFEEILKFCFAYLDKAQEEIIAAGKKAEETLISIATRPVVHPDAYGALRNDVNKLREVLSTTVPQLVRNTERERASSDRREIRESVAATIPEVNEVIRRIEGSKIFEMKEAPATTNFDDLQEEIQKTAPEINNLLYSTGFFQFKKFYPSKVKPAAESISAYTAAQLKKIQQAKQQLNSFKKLMPVEPIGYLHLEKLNFTPVGYQRGELVYSLPMLPGETVRVTHREWSRTETEFEKIITDSLETFTEEALVEKSELTSSSQEEQKHDSAFNASARVSGTYGPVTVSAEAGYNSSNAEARSRMQASKNSRENTQKASSRVKKEQKITFRVSTKYEVEDQSYREITNGSTEAVRWDFHRLMKKWRIDLYRFDVRMTYDIVIPEPGSYLMRKYVKLQRLKDEFEKAFTLNFTPTSITRNNWPSLGAQYGVAIDAPPAEYVSIVAKDYQTYSSRTISFAHVEVRLPDGYSFDSMSALGSSIVNSSNQSAGKIDVLDPQNQARLSAGAKDGNSFNWRYYVDWSEPATPETGTTLDISIFAKGKITDTHFNQWRAKSYERLVDAARGQFDLKRQALKREIDQLEQDLYRDDALVLRKIEIEEIMKGVLRWVLGPDFAFYPSTLPGLSLSETSDLEYYDSQGNLKYQLDYENLLKHGDIIRFLHQAIEWENVLYILYPYFWTDDTRWDFKQSLYHTDYIHRSFLRAGAARVVLTIRPGFEKSFLSFMETLDLGKALAETHPYITVAEEMKQMAQTNYPFTPGANIPPKENLVDSWFEFTPTGALDVKAGETLSDDNT